MLQTSPTAFKGVWLLHDASRSILRTLENT